VPIIRQPNIFAGRGSAAFSTEKLQIPLYEPIISHSLPCICIEHTYTNPKLNLYETYLLLRVGKGLLNGFFV
jgi:hypothetical protein